MYGKTVSSSADWNAVADELAAEELKIASYDGVILERLGDVRGSSWFDYGSGPGVLASAGQRLGADMHAYDVNPDMCRKAADLIGTGNVSGTLQETRGRLFDIITCNLVLCIVDEWEVERIAQEIRQRLRKDGTALIGFCNPQIFDVPETQLDIRFPTGDTYWQHHRIPKIKKEGIYQIFDDVRPLSWYHDIFMRAGLEQTGLLTTPSYKMPGSNRTIRDFVIFEQTVA